MKLIVKSLAIGAMALSTITAEARIAPVAGVDPTLGSELILNVWNIDKKISYAKDLGVYFKDVFNDPLSMNQSWSSPHLNRFMANHQAGDRVVWNIAAANSNIVEDASSGEVFFNNTGLMFSSVLPPAAHDFVVYDQSATNIDVRIIRLNDRSNLLDGRSLDYSNHRDSWAEPGMPSYFLENWGNNINGQSGGSNLNANLGQDTNLWWLGFSWDGVDLGFVTRQLNTMGPMQFTIANGVADLRVVPVPAAVWLLGTGLIGLLATARRRSA